MTGGENAATFDSEPNTRWQFEVLAANPMGESPLSRPVYSQTQVRAGIENAGKGENERSEYVSPIRHL